MGLTPSVQFMIEICLMPVHVWTVAWPARDASGSKRQSGWLKVFVSVRLDVLQADRADPA
jgi:hypothetical protein